METGKLTTFAVQDPNVQLEFDKQRLTLSTPPGVMVTYRGLTTPIGWLSINVAQTLRKQDFLNLYLALKGSSFITESETHFTIPATSNTIIKV